MDTEDQRDHAEEAANRAAMEQEGREESKLPPIYVAIVNVPGYLAERDTAWFDDAQSAWSWLADERRRDEESDEDASEYTDTVSTLDYIASGEHQHGNPHEDYPTRASGGGYVLAGTPGSDSPHDLGLVYRVSVVRHSDYPHEAGYLHGCRACEARCWCAEDPSKAECVYGGEHV